MKDKRYLNIKEVSKRLNIEEHTIRHWDSKISGISTRLHKNGNRFFNNENINKLEKLKNLLYANGKKNYSLELANSLINQKKYKYLETNRTELNSLDRGEKDIKMKEILSNIRNLIKNL